MGHQAKDFIIDCAFDGAPCDHRYVIGGGGRVIWVFFLKGEPPPECIPCNCPLTTKHLLTECADVNYKLSAIYILMKWKYYIYNNVFLFICVSMNWAVLLAETSYLSSTLCTATASSSTVDGTSPLFARCIRLESCMVSVTWYLKEKDMWAPNTVEYLDGASASLIMYTRLNKMT